MNREEKLKRYKEQKELQAELKALKAAMDSPSWDEQTKREYFIALIKSYINQSLDELNSIDAEKSLLDFMEQMKGNNNITLCYICFMVLLTSVTAKNVKSWKSIP